MIGGQVLNIVFVLSHTPDPRMNKRINLLKGIYNVSLVFWNRDSKDFWKTSRMDIESKEIKIKTIFTNPFKRFISTCRFTVKAIGYLRKKNPELIYTGNIDMLAVCCIYSFFKREKPKIIYEIADLHRFIIDDPKSAAKKMIRKLIILTEKILCRYVNVLVLTSEKFYDTYFKNMYPKDKMIFMPNMPELHPFASYRPKTDGAFTVGFIGAVRYKEQMKMLIESAKKCGIKVLFAGAGIDDEIAKICAEDENIEYYGSYDYDSEIAGLYGRVDCVFSVYNADMNNVKVALPNKLYEAIYCEIPIIVAKGTYLAELVEKMGVGVAVSHNDAAELEEVLIKLSTDKGFYNSLAEVCQRHKDYIDLSIYNKQLLNRIEMII